MPGQLLDQDMLCKQFTTQLALSDVKCNTVTFKYCNGVAIADDGRFFIKLKMEEPLQTPNYGFYIFIYTALLSNSIFLFSLQN